MLAWGDGPSQALIIRNTLPNATFHKAVQDVTPTSYTAPSDAPLVMEAYYPRVAVCLKAVFEAVGAAGCLDP